MEKVIVRYRESFQSSNQYEYSDWVVHHYSKKW